MTTGSARGGVSPSSSPRLPSPPPFTEVQIGPKSPTIGDSNNNPQLGDGLRMDDGALRRIRPGTKASEMASGPPMVEINEVCMISQYPIAQADTSIARIRLPTARIPQIPLLRPDHRPRYRQHLSDHKRDRSTACPRSQDSRRFG
jgi:hypothetical protein